jgi:hypothetical protein
MKKSVRQKKYYRAHVAPEFFLNRMRIILPRRVITLPGALAKSPIPVNIGFFLKYSKRARDYS